MSNSQTLYLRPISNIPQYRLRGAARWMIYHYPHQFNNVIQAKLYLMGIEQTNPQLYKSILRRYFEASDYSLPKVPTWRDPNRYFSTHNNSYGEDLHTYWRANLDTI
jgi:hypothetical protein